MVGKIKGFKVLLMSSKFQSVDQGHNLVILTEHGSPKWSKYEKNCLAQTPYFFKRVYPKVSKSSNMKFFRSYQKE